MKLQASLDAGRPYSLAFVDVRMPPGWDGIETVSHLWQAYPALQVVICTAYSDYSWDEMRARLGRTDSLVVLKKPFDNVEVQQLAHALTRKLDLTHQAELKMQDLERMVALRTAELETAIKSLFDVPDTERQLLAVRLEAIAAERNRRDAIVDLYIALGG